MKASDRIVSIMMAAVVVLFAFLLLTTVGGNQRDGFKEGEVINKPRGPQAQATKAEVKPATKAEVKKATKEVKQDLKKVGATTAKTGTAKVSK